MNLLQQLQGVVGVLLVVVVVIVFARRAVGRARGQRPTANGNALEVIDEVFSPARHTAAMELRAQQHQGPVTPAPEDWEPGTGAAGAPERLG